MISISDIFYKIAETIPSLRRHCSIDSKTATGTHAKKSAELTLISKLFILFPD
jgi:hypothetical protein